MRRWHQERELMLGRWRMEVEKHEGRGALFPPVYCAGDCHCFLGMGVVRKRKPYDCGHEHCYMCHGDKWFPGMRRARELREAFAHEWLATGGW